MGKLLQRLRKDSNLRCLSAHFLSREAPSTSRTRKQKWAGLDLNQQNPKAPDLQSGPLPITVYLPICDQGESNPHEQSHNLPFYH